MSAAAVLTDLDVERVARRVVELLRDERQEPPGPGELVDATTLARLLGLRRSTVYDRADALGAVRLGSGKRARLRFDVDRARAALADRSSSSIQEPAAPRPPRPARRARPSRAGEVLRSRPRRA